MILGFGSQLLEDQQTNEWKEILTACWDQVQEAISHARISRMRNSQQSDVGDRRDGVWKHHKLPSGLAAIGVD